MAELITNSMRFCGDLLNVAGSDEEETTDGGEIATANLKRKGFLKSTNKFIDLTNVTSVEGFSITPGGSAYSDCKRRLVFGVDDPNDLWRWDTTQGKMIPYTGAGYFKDVIVNGNKPDVLNAITSIPEWVGKKIYPRIAIQAPYDREEMPVIKLGIKYRSTTESKWWRVNTVAYTLGDDGTAPIIDHIEYDAVIQGSATISITVRLKESADANWSSFMTLEEAADKTAYQCQFQIYRTVSVTDGTDKVTLNSISIFHTTGKTLVSGNYADIYTVVQDYEEDLGTCYVVVRHDELSDSKITAYCNFMSVPKKREFISLGLGTGSRKQYVLGVDGVADTNINPSSIEIYEGDQKLTDFGFNTENSEVTITARNGYALAASYEYDCDVEDWQQMTLETRQPYGDGDRYMSRFSYSLPLSTTGKKIANVRIRLNRPYGTVTNWLLGTGTGKKKLFAPKHIVNESTIKFNPTVTGYNYDADANILAVTQKKNQEIRWSYTWRGEPITIYSIAAGFSARL